MSERLFNPQNVAGERPYTEIYTSSEAVERVHSSLGFIVGVTAVHGLEPQQIAANVGLSINSEFEMHELPQKPVVLPYVPGHPIYGDRNVDVLRKVYTPEQQQIIFLSQDLGHALLHTEFGSAGYQQHLDNVRHHVGEVDSALEELTRQPFSVMSLDGKNTSTLDPRDKRTLEINAGSNSTLARGSDRVSSYEVFPVTFDGLVQYISRHNKSFFGYDRRLLRDVGNIAQDLRSYFSGIILPDIHTLGEEKWFGNSFPEAFITPAWKEKLAPPEIEVDEESRAITVYNHTGKVETSKNYNPEKGVIYLNVSGNDMGAQAAKRFVLSAQESGYTVAAPDWLREMWIREEQGKDSKVEDGMRNVLAAEPNILFAKDGKGDNLCKAFFMRLGMGSYAYAQRAGIPIIFLGFESLDNPEMKGNSAVIERHNLGIRYTGQPDLMGDVEKLRVDFEGFNNKVYKDNDIPAGVEGLPAVAHIILLDQIAKTSRR